MLPEDERQRILAAASRLLRDEGPHALSNRRVADAAGCTTMAIYSRFGGKLGLVDALYREGLEVLAAEQAKDVPDDPLQALSALVLAYRRTALEHPGHYAILFGNAIPGFQPSESSRLLGLEAFGRLERAIERCRASGASAAAEETRALAYRVFASCHGLVSAELAGFAAALGIDRPEDTYLATVQQLLEIEPP